MNEFCKALEKHSNVPQKIITVQNSKMKPYYCCVLFNRLAYHLTYWWQCYHCRLAIKVPMFKCSNVLWLISFHLIIAYLLTTRSSRQRQGNLFRFELNSTCKVLWKKFSRIHFRSPFYKNKSCVESLKTGNKSSIEWILTLEVLFAYMQASNCLATGCVWWVWT